jgi:hypothetical protein
VKLAPGEARNEVVRARLDSAALVLLLLRADDLGSESCHAEMRFALERASAGRGRVVPILLRPFHADRHALGDLAVLPTGGRPVTMSTGRTRSWAPSATPASTGRIRPSEPG